MTSKIPLEKVTIRLYKGDAQKLDEFYPQTGYNKIIRNLVRVTIKNLEEKANRLTPQRVDSLEAMKLVNEALEEISDDLY